MIVESKSDLVLSLELQVDLKRCRSFFSANLRFEKYSETGLFFYQKMQFSIFLKLKKIKSLLVIKHAISFTPGLPSIHQSPYLFPIPNPHFQKNFRSKFFKIFCYTKVNIFKAIGDLWWKLPLWN